MTGFALAQIRRVRKLLIVVIPVTVRARGKLELVNGLRARRNMAFGAFDIRMLAEQWICRARVVRHAEGHLLESGNRMTRLALASIRALRELTIVRITVAIGALPERDYLRKIVMFMARFALYFGVLSNQWIWRFGVVELRCGCGCLPGSCAVTTLAGLLEEPSMWIRMARVAGLERQA